MQNRRNNAFFVTAIVHMLCFKLRYPLCDTRIRIERRNITCKCSIIFQQIQQLHVSAIKHCEYVCVCGGGPGSSVGIATELRAGRSGIESRWGEGFPPVQTGPGAHPASCKIGTGSFPGVKCGRGVLLTTHTLLMQWSRKSRATLLTNLWTKPGL